MKTFRYLANVVTLELDQTRCVGCTMCTIVCPHRVLVMQDKKATIVDRDGCIECGGCAQNCPADAISLSPGVGCASLIINRWLNRSNSSVGGCC